MDHNTESTKQFELLHSASENAHAIMPQVGQDTKEIAKSISYQSIALTIIVTIVGLLLFLTFKQHKAMHDLNYTNASISMLNI